MQVSSSPVMWLPRHVYITVARLRPSVDSPIYVIGNKMFELCPCFCNRCLFRLSLFVLIPYVRRPFLCTSKKEECLILAGPVWLCYIVAKIIQIYIHKVAVLDETRTPKGFPPIAVPEKLRPICESDTLGFVLLPLGVHVLLVGLF